MTTRVDFYLLNIPDSSARLPFICKLIEKAYQQKHSIYVHTTDQDEAKQLDDLLWTYHDTSFIPHGLYHASMAANPPVLIGFEKPPENTNEILINLTMDIPEFYRVFQRVIEVIPLDTQWQESARQHYRFYRSENCELFTHDLKK